MLYSIRNQHDSEIGTGFYVEKKPSETTDFLDRKLKIVDANSENITRAVQATRYVQFFSMLRRVYRSGSIFPTWPHVCIGIYQLVRSLTPRGNQIVFNSNQFSDKILKVLPCRCKERCLKYEPDKRDKDTVQQLKPATKEPIILA